MTAYSAAKVWTFRFATASGAAIVALGMHGMQPSPPPGTAAVSLVVSSTEFSAGSSMPAITTCDGANRSPDLSWTWMPANTESIAIVFDELDKRHQPIALWVVWNMKPGTRYLAAGADDVGGGTVGTNDLGHVRYDGPCPAPGKLGDYQFHVYALDTPVLLVASDKRAELDRAMNGHVVAEGVLRATYQR